MTGVQTCALPICPVGHALMGKAVGDKAEVLLPTGHTVEYTVLNITHAAG